MEDNVMWFVPPEVHRWHESTLVYIRCSGVIYRKKTLESDNEGQGYFIVRGLRTPDELYFPKLPHPPIPPDVLADLVYCKLNNLID